MGLLGGDSESSQRTEVNTVTGTSVLGYIRKLGAKASVGDIGFTGDQASSVLNEFAAQIGSVGRAVGEGFSSLGNLGPAKPPAEAMANAKTAGSNAALALAGLLVFGLVFLRS